MSRLHRCRRQRWKRITVPEEFGEPADYDAIKLWKFAVSW